MSTLGKDGGVKLISTMNCHFISVEHSSKVFYYIFYEEEKKIFIFCEISKCLEINVVK